LALVGRGGWVVSARTSLLFVCLGNICRSPLAEAIFVHLAQARGAGEQFLVDSCGLGGWHAGEPPDPRARAVAERRGVRMSRVARKVDAGSDFARFDLLLPMDLENRDRLLEIGAPPGRVRLVRSFDRTLAGAAEGDLAVPDPYYGGPEGFERVFEMLERACGGLLEEVLDGGAEGRLATGRA
jgi:protein-tyrosine phosphatase